MPDPGNGATPGNGTELPEEEAAELNVEEIDPEDTAQLNLANLKALLNKAKQEARANAKATRSATNSVKLVADTRQFKTGGFRKS